MFMFYVKLRQNIKQSRWSWKSQAAVLKEEDPLWRPLGHPSRPVHRARHSCMEYLGLSVRKLLGTTFLGSLPMRRTGAQICLDRNSPSVVSSTRGWGLHLDHQEAGTDNELSYPARFVWCKCKSFYQFVFAQRAFREQDRVALAEHYIAFWHHQCVTPQVRVMDIEPKTETEWHALIEHYRTVVDEKLREDGLVSL